MSPKPLTRTWEVTPEDASIQWTVDSEGSRGAYGAVYSHQLSGVVDAADWPLPTLRTVWFWSVESSRDGDSLAEGRENTELSAKRAAEVALDEAKTDPSNG